MSKTKKKMKRLLKVNCQVKMTKTNLVHLIGVEGMIGRETETQNEKKKKNGNLKDMSERGSKKDPGGRRRENIKTGKMKGDTRCVKKSGKRRREKGSIGERESEKERKKRPRKGSGE